jgi:hypothetical protein
VQFAKADADIPSITKKKHLGTPPNPYYRITYKMDPTTRDSVGDTRLSTTEADTAKGWRFWLIFACLALTAFLSALEGSIVSTALPSIARALKSSEDYIWVVNVYYLTRYVFA